jgi:sorbitol/mannitol transport system permease protein
MSAEASVPVAAPAAVPTSASRGEKLKSLLMWPSVVPLLAWMIVPLLMTIAFSFVPYNLLNPAPLRFVGIQNYKFLTDDPSFFPAILNTIIFMVAVLAITVVFGVLLAVLYDQEFFGKNVAMLFVIAPFFVMPTVSALIWKNMLMHPVYGLISVALRAVGLPAVDWFAEYPLFSIIVIVSWEWIPFAFLILVTAIKSLDQEQKEAAAIDGAGPFTQFWYIVIPHLQRAITVVIMIETIFLLSIFAEIYTTTSGGPGHATTTLAFLVYALGLQQYDAGVASAGGILAVILANIVSIFLVRILAKNLSSAT